MRTFEPGSITLTREARSLASRRIDPGVYEIARRTPAGNYQLFQPDGGKFAAIVSPEELSRAAEGEQQ